MALSWLTALKAVPWADVVQAAPGIVQGARKLFTAAKEYASADGASANPQGARRTDALEARLQQIETGLDALAADQRLERSHDPRGEDVSSFTLAEGRALDRQGDVDRGHSVQQLHRLVPWYAFLAFVLLGILACGPRLRDPMVALSFFFLLMMFPHSLVFGQGLNYRSLMFAPFFCLAAVRFSTTRWCVPAIALLALADLVVLADALTARA